MKKPVLLAFIFVTSFIIPFSAFGQGMNNSTNEIKTEALKNYTDGNYDVAYELYSTLLQKYPKDGIFNYYAGLCLFYQNKDIEKAIEYLEFASGKPTVPSDVFYFLGQAYRAVYMFPDSKMAFTKYNSVADRTNQKELIPAREAEMSRNAMSLTMEYNPFEIQATSLFSFSDSLLINHVRGKGGILNKKPLEFYTRDESEGDLSTFIFFPREIIKGEYVYFSGYGKSRKKGLELFRVKKMTGKKWGEPELLTSLNTEFDELLPYFDPVGKDLYFASKGYNSIGGYDVFKSHYDPERDEWSEPVNMGFPVNSPKNEYLAMPGYDLGTILVMTDRQGLRDKMTVYKLKLSEPKKSLASASNEELRRIGNLGGISAIPAIVDLTTENIVSEPVNEINVSESISSQKKPEPQKPDLYKTNIQSALSYQHTSDSLTRLAKATRLKVSSIPDPNERWAFQSQIIDWENLARDYQEKADLTYAKVQEMEPKKTNSIPPAIEKKKEINGITVYEYSDAVVKNEINQDQEIKNNPETKAGGTFNTADEPGEVVAIVQLKNGPDINRFVILDRSPYNSNNPFPLDVKLPEKSFYRIQLGVFSKTVSYDNFGGISPITAESVPGKTLTRYYAGKFSNFTDAKNALEKVKQKGYTDSYIVGWYDGERMALNRVQEFEARDKGDK